MEATIVSINAPLVIFDNGDDCEIRELKGTPRVGATVDLVRMAVTGNNVNQDCPGGVCPVR